MTTQFMLKLGIDPEKLYQATFTCQYGLCCCNMALVSFRLFRKNLGHLRDFFGQMVYPPPPGKKFSVRLWFYRYEVGKSQSILLNKTIQKTQKLSPQILSFKLLYCIFFFFVITRLLYLSVKQLSLPDLSSIQRCVFMATQPSSQFQARTADQIQFMNFKGAAALSWYVITRTTYLRYFLYWNSTVFQKHNATDLGKIARISLVVKIFLQVQQK